MIGWVSVGARKWMAVAGVSWAGMGKWLLVDG